MRKNRKLFHAILIALVVSLAWSSASQAAYEYKYKLAVDHTRVAGLDGTPPKGFGFLKSITIDHTQVEGSGVSPPSGFGYLKEITIDSTKVSGTSDLTDFPVLVSIQSNAALKTTANGGRVTDPDGDDLVFYAADLTTVLDYEVKQYDGTAGTLVAWVRLPVLSFALDTVFYLAYGNDGIDFSLADPAGVWDSDFKGVWHMKEEAAGTGATDLYKDSTANANHGDDLVSDTGQNGKIGSGQGFDGTDDQLNFGSGTSLNIRNAITMSAWIDLSTRPSKDKWFNLHGNSTYTYGLFVYSHSETLTTLGAELNLDTGKEDLWDSTSIDIDPADGWAHVTVTFDGTDCKFYVNGQLDNTENIPGTIDDGTGVDVVFADDENEWFDGSVDEIRLSGTARSAAWIATEYNNQSDPGGFMTVEDAGALIDFPVLVSLQNDATIKTTANGGRLTDLQGDDLRFYAADLTTELDYEVEQYDGAAGTLVAWVRLPSLAHYVDTVFYLAYGNSGISSPRPNASGVWNNSYQGVWHLNNDPGPGGPGDIKDSTSNNNHGTADGSMVSGDLIESTIAGGLEFDASSNQYVSLGTLGDFGSTLANATYQFWIKTTQTTVFTALGTLNDGADSAELVQLNSNHFGATLDGSMRTYTRADGRDGADHRVQ